MPANLRHACVCGDEDIADHVMLGICAAIDRAFARGGEAIVTAAAREARAKRAPRKPSTSASVHMAGWIPHGESVYHHVSDPSILVKRIGRVNVRREGAAPSRVNVWGWRPAGGGGAWRGRAESRVAAFGDARATQELENARQIGGRDG